MCFFSSVPIVDDAGGCADGGGVAVVPAAAVYVHFHDVGHRWVLKLRRHWWLGCDGLVEQRLRCGLLRSGGTPQVICSRFRPLIFVY